MNSGAEADRAEAFSPPPAGSSSAAMYSGVASVGGHDIYGATRGRGVHSSGSKKYCDSDSKQSGTPGGKGALVFTILVRPSLPIVLTVKEKIFSSEEMAARPIGFLIVYCAMNSIIFNFWHNRPFWTLFSIRHNC